MRDTFFCGSAAPSARLFLFGILISIIATTLPAADTTSPAPDLAAKLPANQWVEIPMKIQIPPPWDTGRVVHVNSFGSAVYADSPGEVLLLDGYTTAPAGKSVPNNYSDSLYAFNPMTGIFRLAKRSNWRAGARSGDPKICSYPYDENKDDPTPCPRHTYNGICYSSDSDRFYLINGANAGVPNKHPKFEPNGGTDAFTFWEYNIQTSRWTRLEYPPVKRKEPYDTVLRPVPGTGRLYLFGVWSTSRYDIKAREWKVLVDSPGGGAVGAKQGAVSSYSNGARATVDNQRQWVVFHGGSPWRAASTNKPAVLAMNELIAFDAKTETYQKLTGKGTVEGVINAGFARVDHMDRYALRTEKGLFLFSPETQEWARAAIEPLPVKSDRDYGWNYMVYDTQRRLLILCRHHTWAALRLDAATLKLETGN